MRWDSQLVDEERPGELPGVGAGTRVRTFDAPEAMGVRFHEVEARSVLNHVPGGRYGFSWTVNAFRGCSHACVYCAAPETEVMTADGETLPIAALRKGDPICGTEVLPGGERRLVLTHVEEGWRTVKQALRVSTADGMELVASADHRLLTERGWRSVGDGLRAGDRLLATRGDLDVRSGPRSVIAAVEPLGHEMELVDITTGTGDFIANGVVSHNCFARRTHPYLGFDAGRDFEREIIVKVNTPEVLRAELGRASWSRDLVALGTNTDPYQWVEGRYRFMPGILAALEQHRTPVSVLTKSALVMRDADIYEEMAKALDVSVNLSIPTLDEKAWRATEPHTPSPRARLEAVAELKRRGVSSGVLVAPLMPGINDAPEQVEPLVELAREAGADFVGGVALHLRDEVRDVFFGWLQAKRPDLVPRYEALFANGRAYMRPEDRREVGKVLRGYGDSRNRRRHKAEASPRRVEEGSGAPPPLQLPLL